MHQKNCMFEYVPWKDDDPDCLHVVLSDRAYAAIIAETLDHGENETGMVFLGNIYRRVWYVTECVPAGTAASHSRQTFTLDLDFVNYVAAQQHKLYRYPVSVLGFWHRHPGSMDMFSGMDMETMHANLAHCPNGLVSMLVNVDPELRMTFYHAKGNRLMRVQYDHGDAYFPQELLEMATAEQLIQRSGTPHMSVKERQWIKPEQLPRHIAECVADEPAAEEAPVAEEAPAAEQPTAQEAEQEPQPAAGMTIIICPQTVYLPMMYDARRRMVRRRMYRWSI